MCTHRICLLPALSLSLAQTMEPFIQGFEQNLAAVVERENLTTMAAVGIAAACVILVPIGRRFAWHMWNASKGAYEKAIGTEDIEVPEELAEALERQQQQQQQQVQQQVQQQAVTPTNSKVKADENGQLIIYSKSADIKGNLLPDFEQQTQSILLNFCVRLCLLNLRLSHSSLQQH